MLLIIYCDGVQMFHVFNREDIVSMPILPRGKKLFTSAFLKREEWYYRHVSGYLPGILKKVRRYLAFLESKFHKFINFYKFKLVFIGNIFRCGINIHHPMPNYYSLCQP